MEMKMIDVRMNLSVVGDLIFYLKALCEMGCDLGLGHFGRLRAAPSRQETADIEVVHVRPYNRMITVA